MRRKGKIYKFNNIDYIVVKNSHGISYLQRIKDQDDIIIETISCTNDFLDFYEKNKHKLKLWEKIL